MSEPKKPKTTFEVIVFDMYDCDSEIYVSGFPTLEAAREYARRRTRASVEEQRPGSTSSKDLSERWSMFGEDCTVVGGVYSGQSELDYFIAHPATPAERDWLSLEPPRPPSARAGLRP